VTWLSECVGKTLDDGGQHLEKAKIDIGMRMLKPKLVTWVEEAVAWFKSPEGQDLVTKGWEHIHVAWNDEIQNSPDVVNVNTTEPLLWQQSEPENERNYYDGSDSEEYLVTGKAESPTKWISDKPARMDLAKRTSKPVKRSGWQY